MHRFATGKQRKLRVQVANQGLPGKLLSVCVMLSSSRGFVCSSVSFFWTYFLVLPCCYISLDS